LVQVLAAYVNLAFLKANFILSSYSYSHKDNSTILSAVQKLISFLEDYSVVIGNLNEKDLSKLFLLLGEQVLFHKINKNAIVATTIFRSGLMFEC